jgi:predicted RND superfamily exporter protein
MSLADRVAHLVVHRPRILWITLVVLLCVSALLIFVRAKMNTEVLDMLPSHFESVNIYKLADKEFGTSQDLFFGLIAPNDEVDLDGFTQHFAEALRQEPWAVRVMDQPPFMTARGLSELNSVVLPLILNTDETDFRQTLEALRPEAISERLKKLGAKLNSGLGKTEFEAKTDPLGVIFPALKNIQFEAPEDDPLFRLVMVHVQQRDLDEPACRETMDRVADFQKRVLASWTAEKKAAPQILCSGRSAYVVDIASVLKFDLTWTLTDSMLLAALTFYIGFRKWRPLRAITESLLLSCLLAVACGAAIFGELNQITVGLCSLLVGLGIDLAMMLYALYLHECEHGRTHEQAIAAALRTHGKGIWFGTLTTAAAFLCLLASGSRGFSQLGVLIACGILLCGVVMMSFLWIFLSLRLPRWLYHFLVSVACLLALAALVYIGLSFRTWSTVVWNNIWCSIGAGIFTLALVAGLGKVTPKLPALLLSRPWRLMGPALVVLSLVFVGALLPGVGHVAFDLDPKTLKPKVAADDDMHIIMDHLNRDKRDTVFAVIQAHDAESLSTGWTKAQAAWQKLTPAGTPAGAAPLLASAKTPAGLATSPARMAANAARLRSVDLAASKKAFTDALAENQFIPEQFTNANALFDAFEQAAAGKLSVTEWQHNLPENSAWWFVLDSMLSRNHPLGRAMLKPLVPLDTADDVAALRKALQVPGVEVGFSGWEFTLAELRPWSETTMQKLTVMMVGLNIIILAALLRRWKPVAIIMLGLVFSVAGMFLTLKLTGIQLNLFNILAFPLVLGVGVDYSIYACLAVQSPDPAHDLKGLMKPLLLSGLTTVIGFISLFMAQNPALQGLGLLCGIGIGWCMLTTFVFILPACVREVRADERHQENMRRALAAGGPVVDLEKP